MNPLKSEPALTVGVIMAVIYIAVAFGAPITPDQQRVMQEQLPVVVPVILAGFAAVRQMVFAPDTAKGLAEANVEKGYEAGQEGKRKPAAIVTPPPGDEFKAKI